MGKMTGMKHDVEQGSKVKNRNVDGGWAWVALVVAIFINVLQSCFVISVGFFLVEFQESFPGSKGFIALIGSLAVSGQALLGPAAGIISTMVTHRMAIIIGGALTTLGLVTASFSQDTTTLLLLFGIVCGCGTGLCYTPAITSVSLYFHKYRTVANGISLAAPGIGLLLTPTLVQWLIQTYGWRFAMAAFGCIMAQTCVLASLLFPHHPSTSSTCCCQSTSKATPPQPEQDSIKPPINRNLDRLKNSHNAQIEVMVGSRTAMHVSEFGSMLLSNSVVWTVEEVKFSMVRRLKQLLSRRFMWVMCLSHVLLMGGVSVNTLLFPSFALSQGVPPAQLPYLYMVYGITMTVSRVCGGVVFSFIPQHMLKIFFSLMVCVAVTLALVPVFGTSLAGLFVYKFLFGVTYSPAFLLITPILIHYIGLEDLSVAFGIIMLCCGCSYIIAPPLGGWMFDMFGSYKITFYFAGCMAGLGALSLLLLVLIKDLRPVEEDSVKQTGLLTADEKKCDNSLSHEHNGDLHEKVVLNGNSVAVTGEKIGMNGVRVINDMEDLHEFIQNGHS